MRRRTQVPVLLLLATLSALGLAGCGGPPAGADASTPDPDDPMNAECNPLGATGCVLPWPSTIHQIADSSTATGMRLDIPAGAFPVNFDDIELDPAPFNRRDGFSPGTNIYTSFRGGVDPSNLVGYGDYGASLTDASPTVLIDMSTGERVAHFAEVDANAAVVAVVPEDYDYQALYLRPAARLKSGTRYAVGIRTSLEARGGGALPVPVGFRAILDGTPTEHARLERVRGRYDDIFAAFEAQGIGKDELVVAWDFVTASDDALIAPLLSARDAALVAMGEAAANMSYQIATDEPLDDGAQIARRITGTFQAPWVLTGDDGIGGLNRNAQGQVVVDGTLDADFLALVPNCPEERRPLPVIVFGHGFFGGLGETGGAYLRRVSQELCMVVIGTPWYGMSSDDVSTAALALNDANYATAFGERIVQGMVNGFTLVQLLRGKFATELLVDGEDSIIDSSKIYFYGISQGHILGSTFVAFDPVIERAVLAVGGASWSLLFERSTHWNTYGLILKGAYPGPLNMVIMQGLLQLAFDPTDPVNTAHRVYSNPIPNTPPKQLLLHQASGDSQVTNLSTELQARTLGIPVLAPAVRVPWGLTEASGPLDNALVIFDEHPNPPPNADNLLNNKDNGTHGTVRRRAAAVQQIETFFNTGEIVHTCGDATPCDCTTGACGPLD